MKHACRQKSLRCFGEAGPYDKSGRRQMRSVDSLRINMSE